MINPYRKASKREIQYRDRWNKSVAMPWFDVVLATMRARYSKEKWAEWKSKNPIVRKVGDMGARVEL